MHLVFHSTTNSLQRITCLQFIPRCARILRTCCQKLRYTYALYLINISLHLFNARCTRSVQRITNVQLQNSFTKLQQLRLSLVSCPGVFIATIKQKASVLFVVNVIYTASETRLTCSSVLLFNLHLFSRRKFTIDCFIRNSLVGYSLMTSQLPALINSSV